MQPVIAVFVDPRAVDTGENRRGPELLTNPRFQSFLTQELIPWIDARYPTRPLAEARAIAGMSLGGLHATYTAMRQPEWFGLVGVLSPYLSRQAGRAGRSGEVEAAARQAIRQPGRRTTTTCENTRHLRTCWRKKGYDFEYVESNDGHSWGNWRNVLDDMLIYFFATN